MNVDSPEFLIDPYRFYAEKRASSSVFRVNENSWTITSYADAAKLMSNPAMGRGEIGQVLLPGADAQTIAKLKPDNPILRILDQWMLFKNPPEHPKIRSLIAQAFKPNNLVEIEQVVERDARDLIDQIRIKKADTFELLSTVAHPLPLITICRMLGIPSDDTDKFRVWTQDLSNAVQTNLYTVPPKILAKWNQSASELESYFKVLVPQKRQHPEQDLISKLVEPSAGLTQSEILANSAFLLFSGMETTTNMISNGVAALLGHQDQLDLLRGNTQLLDNAVDECLRYDPPVQMVTRFALEEIEHSGITIRKGDRVFVFIGAAGRDQDANQAPDAFDITRAKIKHLAFAKGAHHCLGSSLVKIELRAVIHQLISAFDLLELAEPAEQKPSWLMRGMQSVNITYRV